MTFAQLLSNPEFWSALFGAVAGALAAFGLGAASQWWTANSTNRKAGNLALITLGQMYQLVENIRRQFLVGESHRSAALLRRDPFEFELRPITLRDPKLKLAMEELGFLAESNDPDVLARLMTVQHSYEQVLDALEAHARRMREFQDKMAAAQAAGVSEPRADQVAAIVGPNLFCYVVLGVRELQQRIPDTLAAILQVTEDLRNALRMKLPARHFLRLQIIEQARQLTERPDPERPRLWRRAVRATVDALLRPRHFRRRRVASLPAAQPEQQPRIQRFRLPTDEP
jgi:hypothetical protein